MQCSCCSQEKEKSDFFKSDVCFSCLYKKKLEVSPELAKTARRCKMCNKKIPEGRNPGAITCSDKCSYDNKQKHWTKQINIAPLPTKLKYGNPKPL